MVTTAPGFYDLNEPTGYMRLQTTWMFLRRKVLLCAKHMSVRIMYACARYMRDLC